MALFERFFRRKEPNAGTIKRQEPTAGSTAKVEEVPMNVLETLANAKRPIDNIKIKLPTNAQLDREIRPHVGSITPNHGNNFPVISPDKILHAHELGTVNIPGDTLRWFAVTGVGNKVSGGYYTLGHATVALNGKKEIVYNFPGASMQSTNDEGLPSYLRGHINTAIEEYEAYRDFVKLNPTWALNQNAFGRFRAHIYELDGKRKVRE